MMYKMTAIVLGYANYKENDRILRLFTKERGLVNAKARGCRRKNSPLTPAAELFSFGEYEIFRNNLRDTVDSAAIVETFYPIREDYDRLVAASSLAKATARAIAEEEPNERLFFLFYRAISFLAYGDIEYGDIAAAYLVKLSDAIGLRPKITECASCGKSLLKEGELFFSHRDGGAVCSDCGYGCVRVEALTLEAMRRIILLDDENIGRVHLKERTREAIISIMSDFLSVTQR